MKLDSKIEKRIELTIMQSFWETWLGS